MSNVHHRTEEDALAALAKAADVAILPKEAVYLPRATADALAEEFMIAIRDCRDSEGRRHLCRIEPWIARQAVISMVASLLKQPILPLSEQIEQKIMNDSALFPLLLRR